MVTNEPSKRKLMGLVFYDSAYVTCWNCKATVAYWRMEEGFTNAESGEKIDGSLVTCIACGVTSKLRNSLTMRFP